MSGILSAEDLAAIRERPEAKMYRAWSVRSRDVRALLASHEALRALAGELAEALDAYQVQDEHVEDCDECEEGPCDTAWDAHCEAVGRRREALAKVRAAGLLGEQA